MWPFVLGFCSGVVAVLLALLIAFFKLSSKIVRKPSRHHAVQRMQNQIAHKKSGEARSVPEYLEPYNEGVDSETCAWFDILLQRLFVDFSRAAVNVDVERYVNRRIASIRFPEFVGPVVVQHINFGDFTPIFRSMRVLSWRDERPLLIECRVSYKGDANLSLETEVLINFRERRVAALPIELAVSDIQVDGLMHMYITPSVEKPVVEIGFLEEPFIDFEVHSEIGDKITLKDVPHLRTVLLRGLRKVIAEDYLLPARKRFELKGVDLVRELGEKRSAEHKKNV